MPTFNSTVTLDGVNPFDLEFFGPYAFGGGFLRTLDLWDNNGANIHNLTFNLTGSNWTVRDFTTGGDADHVVTLTDQNASGGRFFEAINFFGGGTLTANLQSTGAQSVNLRGGTFDLNLGSGFFGAISMSESLSNAVSNGPGGTIRSLNIGNNDTIPIVNDIDIGGRANQVRIFRGENDIDVTGRIDSLTSNDAVSNALTIAAGGRIDYARLNGIFDSGTGTFSQRSNNDFDVQGRIDYLHIWAGENDLTVGGAGQIRNLTLEESLSTLVVADGGRVDSLRAWQGENTITLQGSARILSMKLDNGLQNVTTGTSGVETYFSYLSTNTVNLGSGGASSVTFESAVGTQTLTASGFVGSFRMTGEGNGTFTFNAGIGGFWAFGGATYTVNIGAGTPSGYNGTIQAFASDVATVTTGDGRIRGIYTGHGADVITTGAGRVVVIEAGAGDDLVTLGIGGSDDAAGNAGNDTLHGSDVADLLNGGEDNDSLTGGGGNDTLFGGTGTDRAEGGEGDDLIEGGASSDTLYGDAGADTLLGGSSGDRAYGGDGDDLIDGGSSADTLYGGAGADAIAGGSSTDLIYGGTENDTIFGGTSNDTIYGGSNNDVLNGDDGNDSLFGGSSADTVNGGIGDDVIDGGSSGDVLNGEAGADSILGGSSADLIQGGTENDTIEGGTGNDTVYGGGHSDLIHGDDGNDSLMGDGSADTIYGGSGTDFIDGGSSADVLYGGSSADTIIGGSSNDTIYGGSSGDVMTGGTGDDVFVFDTGIGTSIDIITDFTVGDDQIRLENSVFTGLAAGALSASAFVANTSGAATNASQRIIYETDTGALYFDADGSGAGAAVRFATLGTGLALTNADFLVV